MILMFTARANIQVLILICILYVSENGCLWIINHSKNQVTWDQFCSLERTGLRSAKYHEECLVSILRLYPDLLNKQLEAYMNKMATYLHDI